jgi:hypothetical protein
MFYRRQTWRVSINKLKLHGVKLTVGDIPQQLNHLNPLNPLNNQAERRETTKPFKILNLY